MTTHVKIENQQRKLAQRENQNRHRKFNQNLRLSRQLCSSTQFDSVSRSRLAGRFMKVVKAGLPCMPYSLLLNADHYSVLMKNATPASDAHSALIKVLPPTKSGHRVLMCTAKTIQELLDLAVRVCPDAVVEISRQIRQQLPQLKNVAD